MSYLSFSVNFQYIHQVYFDVEQRLFVFGLPETDGLPSWTSCTHWSSSTLFIPLSYLQQMSNIVNFESIVTKIMKLRYIPASEQI